MQTTIKYVFLTAIRDLLFIGLILAIVAAILISNFLGGTALVEKMEMSTAYTASSVRLIAVIGMIVFVCFHVRRAFENKEIDLMLSRPISRVAFVFSYWLGFALVATLIVLPVIIAISIFQSYDIRGLFLWGFSLIFECLIVTAFAVFSSIILRSAVSSVLLSFAFYVISRMMGFFIYVIESPAQHELSSVSFYTQKAMWITSFLFPRLDLYGKSEWLIYGIAKLSTDWWWFIPQTLIYVPILLVAAVIDFRKKQF
jgi:ABC-type transport system involved in multi-copper enzyme maturation permease subunit